MVAFDNGINYFNVGLPPKLSNFLHILLHYSDSTALSRLMEDIARPMTFRPSIPGITFSHKPLQPPMKKWLVLFYFREIIILDFANFAARADIVQGVKWEYSVSGHDSPFT